MPDPAGSPARPAEDGPITLRWVELVLAVRDVIREEQLFESRLTADFEGEFLESVREQMLAVTADERRHGGVLFDPKAAREQTPHPASSMSDAKAAST